MAERVFLANGFADTRMQDVASEAGASKETLYRHFGSKEDLFAEVVDNRANHLRERLDADLDAPATIDSVLRDLGTNLLRIMTSPEAIAFMRMVVAETSRDPALGRIFYSVGPGRTLTKLADFFQAAQGRNEFSGRDPQLAASLFLGAIMSQTYMACLLLRDEPALHSVEISRRVDEVVAMFMLRYGPDAD